MVANFTDVASCTAGFDAKIRAPAKLGNWAYIKTLKAFFNRLKTTNTTTYDFKVIQFPDFGLVGLAQSSTFSQDVSFIASFQVLSVIKAVPWNFFEFQLWIIERTTFIFRTSGLFWVTPNLSKSSLVGSGTAFGAEGSVSMDGDKDLSGTYTFPVISCHFLCHGLVMWHVIC